MNDFINALYGNFINVLYENWFYLFFLFVLGLAYSYISRPQFKGVIGEWFVNKHLKKIDLTKSVILKGIILPTENGSTEIDHIIIAPSGIWVIETKCYGGIITINKKNEWFQKFHRRKKIPNPFHQNYKHCKTIEMHTGISEDLIFNHVMLLGILKSKPRKELHTSVSSFISEFNKNKNEFIDVDKTVDLIWNAKIDNNLKNKRKHIKHVEHIKKEKQSNVACKYCNNTNLILKKKYTEYYFCPKCKKNTPKTL